MQEHILDEQLSAFLDAELPKAEMDRIRELLVLDEGLADRLAELSSVDEAVRRHAKSIDSHPIPESVLALLRDESSDQRTSSESGNVIPILRSQTANSPATRSVWLPTAIAASVTLVVGLIAGQYFSPAGPGELTKELSQQLASLGSGQPARLSGGEELLINFSFTTDTGELCRHYVINDADSPIEGLACREDAKWQLRGLVRKPGKSAAGNYQLASSGHALEPVVSDLMAGAPLAREAEQNALKQE